MQSATGQKALAVFMSIAIALAMSTVFAFASPQQAHAKTIKDSAYYTFDSSQKITTSSKKLTFKGKGYRMTLKTYKFKTLKKGTYKFKINSKTKYNKVVETDTGKTKKISKSKAFKLMKNKSFISLRMTVKKGVVKTLSFGAY